MTVKILLLSILFVLIACDDPTEPTESLLVDPDSVEAVRINDSLRQWILGKWKLTAITSTWIPGDTLWYPDTSDSWIFEYLPDSVHTRSHGDFEDEYTYWLETRPFYDSPWYNNEPLVFGTRICLLQDTAIYRCDEPSFIGADTLAFDYRDHDGPLELFKRWRGTP